MPRNKYRIICDNCHIPSKEHNVIRFKGRMLCFNCRQKLESLKLQESVGQYFGLPRSLISQKSRILEQIKAINGYKKPLFLGVLP